MKRKKLTAMLCVVLALTMPLNTLAADVAMDDVVVAEEQTDEESMEELDNQDLGCNADLTEGETDSMMDVDETSEETFSIEETESTSENIVDEDAFCEATEDYEEESRISEEDSEYAEDNEELEDVLVIDTDEDIEEYDASAGVLPSEASVVSTINSFRAKYPDNTVYTGASYTYKPTNTTYSDGLGLIYQMQDKAFGSFDLHIRTDYEYKDIRVGDIVKLMPYNMNYWFIVTGKTDTYVTFASGYYMCPPYNGTVAWDITYTKAEVESYMSSFETELWTRWPEAGSKKSNDLFYLDNGDGTATITGRAYDDPNKDYILIPEKIGNLKVTTVGEGAFSYVFSDPILVADTVSVLKKRAFFNCNSIVMFGNGLRTIEAMALKNTYLTNGLPTPARSGYTFKGWYDSDGNQVTTSQFLDCGYFDYSGVDCKPLTAKWTAGEPSRRAISVLSVVRTSDGVTRRYITTGYTTGVTATATAGAAFSGWEIVHGATAADCIYANESGYSLSKASSYVFMVAHYGESGYLIKNEETLKNESGKWYYYKNGRKDYSYTGLCQYGSTWYFVQNGVVNFNVSGLWNHQGTWYYITNGVLKWGVNGVTSYGGKYYYVNNSQITWKDTGIAGYNGGYYYFKNSTFDPSYTGLASYGKDWYYVTNGVLKWGQDGCAYYGGKWYYVRNSKVDFSYTGNTVYGGRTYRVVNGVVQV